MKCNSCFYVKIIRFALKNYLCFPILIRGVNDVKEFIIGNFQEPSKLFSN